MSSWLKDPDARLDWSWDWTDWLAEDETITDHEIMAPDGITIDSSSRAGGVVTAWVKDGDVGESYSLVCRIETSAGRVDDRRITLRVRQR